VIWGGRWRIVWRAGPHLILRSRWRVSSRHRWRRLAVRSQLGLDVVKQPVHLGETVQGVHAFTRHGQRLSLSIAPAMSAPIRTLPRRSGRYAGAASSDAATSATSVGVRPTRTPLLSSASALALAVPREPDTMAPAWPIVLPGGAVKPAM
jgi:hypothetical protein